MNEQISSFLQVRIDAGDFPSAVYLVAEKGEIVFTDALGLAVIEPERIPARLDTIYDLASVTKVVATGLVVAKLYESGKLDLNERVGAHLPAFNSDDKNSITIKSLLVHDSGLSGWLPMYLLASEPRQVASAIAERPLEYPTGTAVVYSDPNFILLGEIVEKICDTPFDEVCREMIVEPLGLRDTFFNPATGYRPRIAASERGNEFERQLCFEKGYLQTPVGAGGSDSIHDPRSPFRSYPIWGEVHDNNAYFMGGVAGHAGLFSTAEEVFKIAQQFLPNRTSLLKPETCDLFRTNFTPGLNEDRSLAFQLASTEDSTAGTKMSSTSFGHNGFTGTSLWVDPVKERVFVLLTNRTHDHALPFENINSVRRRFHDMAIELLSER
ncbi:MAG: serine hydrolase domain-containing protein [Pyrinomonadaceae bacterium]